MLVLPSPTFRVSYSPLLFQFPPVFICKFYFFYFHFLSASRPCCCTYSTLTLLSTHNSSFACKSKKPRRCTKINSALFNFNFILYYISYLFNSACAALVLRIRLGLFCPHAFALLTFMPQLICQWSTGPLGLQAGVSVVQWSMAHACRRHSGPVVFGACMQGPVGHWSMVHACRNQWGPLVQRACMQAPRTSGPHWTCVAFAAQCTGAYKSGFLSFYLSVPVVHTKASTCVHASLLVLVLLLLQLVVLLFFGGSCCCCCFRCCLFAFDTAAAAAAAVVI